MTAKEAWAKVQSLKGASIVMAEDEGMTLFTFLRELLDTALVVEVGTGYGRSAVLMSLTGKKVITIDNYKDYQSPNSPEFLEDELKDFPITFLNGESVEIAETFADEIIDFLFLDGDHEYESVKKDIEVWLPKVEKGGMVCFHDYNSWKGVTQAVDEVMASGLLQKIYQVDSLVFAVKL